MTKPSPAKETKSPLRRPDRGWPIILLIMLAVLLWGLFLGAGAWLFDYDVRKALIVYGCTLFFLGFWGLLLAHRNRRMR